MPISDVLEGYSKALYSNWLHYRPDRLLVDCGEGAATTLGNNCFGIERVLLTHGHIDHVAGLPSLIWARASGMGDNEKPLQIYFPRGDAYLPDLRTYLETVRSKLPFHLEWIALEAGQSFELKHGRRVETFATQHTKGSQSLGYKIVETRKRLKREFADLTQIEIRQRVQSGDMLELMEEYDGTKIAFGGDSLPLDPDLVTGSEILVHEATIINSENRKGQGHSTLEDALKVGLRAQPEAMLVDHISGRYRRSEIEHAIREIASRWEIGFPVWCLRQDKLWPVWNPHSALAEKS